ncbi:MAG: hypothetical protein EOO77_46430, partial [Oxalobacteraceae bacterium]
MSVTRFTVPAHKDYVGIDRVELIHEVATSDVSKSFKHAVSMPVLEELASFTAGVAGGILLSMFVGSVRVPGNVFDLDHAVHEKYPTMGGVVITGTGVFVRRHNQWCSRESEYIRVGKNVAAGMKAAHDPDCPDYPLHVIGTPDTSSRNLSVMLFDEDGNILRRIVAGYVALTGGRRLDDIIQSIGRVFGGGLQWLRARGLSKVK